MEYQKAIQEILRFKTAFDDINIERNEKIPHKLVGELGEFYVLDALQRNGFEDIQHKGGQSGYDIFLKSSGLRIEVKTSLAKNDGIFPKTDPEILTYGWTALKANQDTPKYDILIGVAIDESFANPNFYIFTRETIDQIDEIPLKRYSSVKKRIWLFADHQTYLQALEIKPKAITDFERHLNEHPEEFRDRWDILEQ